ncbi:MAG: hypothetical protein AMJ79_04995 [Phycisphaerae bacterium SM23_30]|nr:MAG: hypothetical protein AMJ79_04995 [Phycisphaerae bacterium SM23_30]
MHLTRREKRLALALIIFAGASCLYALWIKPASARLDTLQRVIPEKTALRDQLRDKSRQLITLRNRLNRFQQRLADQPDDFDLLPLLESIAQQRGLTENIKAMVSDTIPLDQTYSEMLVTIELYEITLPQLVDFLDRISAAKTLARVKNLNIKNIPSAPDMLDVTLVVSNLKLAQKLPP